MKVEVEVEVDVGVEVGVWGVGVGLTCSHVYCFHGWVVGWCGEVKNRANLNQFSLKLRLSLAIKH